MQSVATASAAVGVGISASSAQASSKLQPAIEVQGKFFFSGGKKHFVKGVTYGPFAPAPHGTQFPERDMVAKDFALMAEMGVNTVRVFTVPPVWLLDIAGENGLKVLVGIPWSQHITFLDSTAVQAEIRRTVLAGVRSCERHHGDLRLSHRQRDPARHGALARRRAGARFPQGARRRGQGSGAGGAGQLRQLPVDRVSDDRFHRFPLLQRLSARRGRVPPLRLAPAQPRRRPAAGPHRVRRRFDARGRGRAARHPRRGRSAPPSPWVSPAPSSSPGPTNGSPAAI